MYVLISFLKLYIFFGDNNKKLIYFPLGNYKPPTNYKPLNNAGFCSYVVLKDSRNENGNVYFIKDMKRFRNN